ncbi:MAG: hypothetical protein D6771_08685, partial [Zetaproteobacteria bacterium]
MRDTPILIAGAGPVGSALALALARAGWAVGVVDAGGAQPALPIALSLGGMRFLRGLGVSVASACPIERVLVSEGDAPPVMFDVRLLAPEWEAWGWVVDLAGLSQAVAAQARKAAAVWMAPARVAAIAQTQSGLKLRLEGAGEETLQAKLLIGADGAAGRIARLAGWRSLLGGPYNRFALVGTLRVPAAPEALAVERFRESGPLALLPAGEGRMHFVCVGAPKEAARLAELSSRALAAELVAMLHPDERARLGAPEGAEVSMVVPLMLRLAPPAVRGRVWLAGAAAHHLHPVAAQGLNLGLRDVETAADILAAPWAREDPGAPIVGEHYAQRRAPDIAATVAVTEGLIAVFATSLLPVRWLRRAALVAL